MDEKFFLLDLEGGTVARRKQYREQVLADAPYAYWPLDEAAGTDAFDISGNNRHAVHTLGPVVNQEAAYKRLGKCVRYDGVDDYTKWTPPSLYAGPFSVEMWFKRDDAARINQTLWTARTGAADYVSCGEIPSDTEAKFDLGNNTANGWRKNITLALGMSLGTVWHHYAATVSNQSEVRVYIDGVERATHLTQVGSSSLWDVNRFFHWGRHERYPGQYQFAGLIDEVAVYHTVLAPARIAAHYAAAV